MPALELNGSLNSYARIRFDNLSDPSLSLWGSHDLEGPGMPAMANLSVSGGGKSASFSIGSRSQNHMRDPEASTVNLAATRNLLGSSSYTKGNYSWRSGDVIDALRLQPRKLLRD
jgi:hypothetical protein